jgi:TetR/AcrR family acrAB operon transcriptional repressor
LLDGLLQNWMLDPDGFDLVRVGTQVLDAYLSSLVVSQAPAAAT